MIPFNKPVFLGDEAERLVRAIRDHAHASAGGPFGARAEELLRGMLGQPVLLTSSGTHALEMAALLLDVAPGDEVILPSFTFVSTANAFALRGATLTFVDVDRSGNLCLEDLTRVMNPRARAVVTVHYAGGSCDIARLLELAGEVPVVEDAAQALGASFRGQPLGSFGRLGALSFHETKNVCAGEGGALTARDPELLRRAERIRDKGTNRRSFLAGEVDRYSWTDLGSSYGLSDLNAAYLAGQLEARERIFARRAELHARYTAALEGPLEQRGGFVVRGHPDDTPNHHLFGMVFEEPEQRTRFIAHMRAHEIVTPFHYVALHRSSMGRRFPSSERPLPWTDRLASCLVRLPLYFNLSDAEQDEVVGRTLEALRAF